MDNNTIMTQKFIDTVVEMCLSDKPEDLIFGIMAPTGSGKSTNLIERIQTLTSEDLNKSTKVFVLQRTIAAVKSLYERMNQLFGSKIKFGYAAESNIVYKANSEIVYCTGGHLENKMLSLYEDGEPKQDIDFCDYLVVDEAHVNSLEQETLVALWKQALIKEFKVPKLIFISATLNMQDIGFPKAKVITIQSKSFPVEIFWNNRDYPIDSKDLYKDTAELIFQNHLTTPIKKINKKVDKNGIFWPGYDTWLCFCPGQKEVINVAEYLNDAYQKYLIQKKENEDDSDDDDNSDSENLEIIPIYGSMNSDVYMKIFVPPKSGIRRIIISTNLAESSITISFVTWIYDTMTEKYTKTTSNGGEILALDNISKASAKQRAGRTGRVCPGKVTRMCTEEYFDSDKLVEQRLPEIKRVPLHNMIIKLLSVGLNPSELFPGRIDKTNLEISIKTLTFLGMLENENGKIIVTEMGHFATRFALSVRGTAILYRWIQSKYDIFPGIVITCLIDCYDNQSYFFYKFNSNNDNIEYYEKYFRKYAGPASRNEDMAKTGLSDIEALIVMWHHLMYSLGGVLRPKKGALKKYCIDNSLNQKKISECLNAISKVYGTLNRSVEEEIKLTAFSPSEAVANITKILNIVYSDNICILSKNKERQKVYQKMKSSFNKSDTLSWYTLDMRCPLTLNSAIYSRILCIRARESQVSGTNKNQNYITLSIPIDTDSHIPEEYEIDYSQTQKIIINDDDTDIVGDDPEDIFENEFLPVKLPTSNKTLFKDRKFFDTSAITMPFNNSNNNNNKSNFNSNSKIPLRTIKKTPTTTTTQPSTINKQKISSIPSIDADEKPVIRKIDKYKRNVDLDEDE
jgi:HrpA-like RNA helicase